MNTFLIEIPDCPSKMQIAELQAELASLAQVEKQPSESFNSGFTEVVLFVAFTANALQIADILVSWLKRTPHGNTAVIRLSDGRTFKMDSHTDPEQFLKQLRATLKEM